MIQYGGTFPACSGQDGGANSVCADYGVTAYPTMVLIDVDKTILEQDMSSSSAVTTIESYGPVAQPCQEQLTALFTINPVTVVYGNTVNFIDESLGDPISWNWTFAGGDPATSTSQNVTVLYDAIGVYPVTLVVSDGTDTHERTEYVYVVNPSAPTPDFVATDTEIMVGESINFLDLTLGNPDEWSWTFQGGSPISSIDQNPTTITYNYPGTYNVYLTTTNAWGTSYSTKYAYITVLAEEPIVEVCDTVTNLLSNDSLVVLPVSPWGVVPGNNFYLYQAYADRYTNSDSIYDKVNGLQAWVDIADAPSGTKVRFIVWSGNTVPTNEIGSKEVFVSSLAPNFSNFIYFDTPLDVAGTFFVGYELVYNGEGVFSCSMAHNRGSNGLSTMLVKVNNNWVPMHEIPLFAGYNTSLGVEPIVCNTTGAIIGVDEVVVADKAFEIYPNPSRGLLNVAFLEPVSSECTIQVFDVSGKQIAVKTALQATDRIQINMQNIKAGLYFIRVSDRNKVHAERILIQP